MPLPLVDDLGIRKLPDTVSGPVGVAVDHSAFVVESTSSVRIVSFSS